MLRRLVPGAQGPKVFSASYRQGAGGHRPSGRPHPGSHVATGSAPPLLLKNHSIRKTSCPFFTRDKRAEKRVSFTHWRRKSAAAAAGSFSVSHRHW